MVGGLPGSGWYQDVYPFLTLLLLPVQGMMMVRPSASVKADG